MDENKLTLEERKQREREFHDNLRKGAFQQRWSQQEELSDPLWSNMKFYSVEGNTLRYIRDWISQRCVGKRVLDYCCGNGEDAIFAAQHGAEHVYGIDISEVSIENCKIRARQQGVQDKTTFLVMDAEDLQFEDNFFDLIVVYGVLHHLDFTKALAELWRVLKSDGAIICTESIKHNPLFQLYRRLTPHLRTEWEVDHILGTTELKQAGKYFGNISVKQFNLITLFAVPLRSRLKLFRALLKILERIDEVLLNIPGLKWWAWQMVFILSQPKKSPDMKTPPMALSSHN